MAELKKNLLRECPFCGGEAKITCESSYGGIETISCKKCHVDVRRLWCEGTSLESEVDVLNAWNNRATEAEIRNKVINEFVKAAKEICSTHGLGTDRKKYFPVYVHEDGTWHDLIADVAERLKEEL